MEASTFFLQVSYFWADSMTSVFCGSVALRGRRVWKREMLKHEVTIKLRVSCPSQAHGGVKRTDVEQT